ncbi:MAG TPA: hypothetical protein VIS07_11795 [Candidatus Binatia bacterium]
MPRALALAAAVTLVLLPTLARGAAPGADEVGGIVIHRLPEARSDEPAWTEEEMDKALPLPLPQREPQRGSAPAPGQPSERIGEGVRGYSYPAPFSRFRTFPNRKYQKAPHKMVGKLFFKRGGANWVCSAASIGNYAIWTAGHCLVDNGVWSTDVVFVPQYRQKSRPKGNWNAAYLISTGHWVNFSDLGDDMGVVILQPLNGKTIGQVVGGLGFAWNQPYERHWFLLGYPAGAPFTGEKQIVCAASFAYVDTAFSPAPMGVGCDQTGGSSGGPWILNYGNGNFLNGNNSYGYGSLEMLSPYFGNGAKALYDCAINSTATTVSPLCG